MLCNNVSSGSKLPLQEGEKEKGKGDEGRKREPLRSVTAASFACTAVSSVTPQLTVFSSLALCGVFRTV